MSDRPARVGPFELRGVLGRGGMGVVWDARHRDTGLDVALKTVSPAVSGAAFHREVQAVAAMRHEGIVEVFDEGIVTAAEASEGLEAGTGYLAMARLDGGTLADGATRMLWSDVKQVLIDILGALAHAHARGVLHLDLKPGNVLRHTEGPWTLVDFGLAHLADSAERGGGLAGTPPYMAPEQLQGRWRDYVPATDLYAVGCLAWELVSGRRWRSTEPAAALSAALSGPAPPPARMAVPAELRGWLDALLAPSPDARFETAAEARWGLLQLGPPEEAFAAGLRSRAEPVDTFDLESVFTAVLPESAVLGAMPGGDHEPDLTVLERRPAPPLPDTWNRAPTRPPTGGLGLGLVGIRALTSIGRRREREALWGGLRETLHTGCSRAIALTGPSGVGRTHLARWLAGRAGETGAVRALEVRGGDPTSVMGQLLEPIARIEGLSPDDAAERLQRRARSEGVDPVLVEALARWVRGEEDVAALPSLIALWLRQLARRRPVLWIVDDADEAAWRLVSEVVSRGDDGRQPLLAVVCCDHVPDDVGAEVLALGPLPQKRWHDLVRGVLGLAPELAVEVEGRAAGSPGAAVQLVQALAQRGALRPSPEGYRLPEGFRLDRVRLDPDASVQEVLERFPPERTHALELLAVLGHRVARAEWEGACRAAAVEVSQEPLEVLVRRGLLLREGSELVLGSAAVRETLLERAREGGRLQRWHDACAEALPDAAPDRLGEHLVGAGRVDEALPHLLDGVRARFAGAEPRAALALLGRCLDLVDDDTPAAVRLRAWHWAAWLAVIAEDHEEAGRWAERILADPAAPVTPRSLGVATHALGVMAVRAGEDGEAYKQLTRAVSAYERSGDTQYRAYAWMMLLDLDPDAPDREATLLSLTASGDRDEASLAHLRLCDLRRRQGQLDDAVHHAEAVRDDAAAHGPFGRLLEAHLRLGDLARAQGRHQDAARILRAARGLASPASTHAMMATVELALLRTEQQRYALADRLWESVMPRLERAERGLARRRGAFLLCRTPCRAAVGDAERFDAELDEGRRLHRGEHAAEVQRMLVITASLWEEQGDEARASAARDVADTLTDSG